MELVTHCELCNKELKYNKANHIAKVQGFPLTQDTHDLSAKSEMHYAHCGRRSSRNQFNNIDEKNWKKMGVENRHGSRICCYECHEVILHNPVFSEWQIKQLARHFKGKSFAERVVILNRVIQMGLEQLQR